jgi:hypothetical protein
MLTLGERAEATADLKKWEGGLLRANTWNIPAVGIVTRDGGWTGRAIRSEQKLLVLLSSAGGY